MSVTAARNRHQNSGRIASLAPRRYCSEQGKRRASPTPDRRPVNHGRLAAAFGRERMNCREFTEFLHDYLLGGLLAEVCVLSLTGIWPSALGASRTSTVTRRLCSWREPRSPRPRTLRLPATRPKSLSRPSFAPVLGTRDLPAVNAPHGPPSIPSGRPQPSHCFRWLASRL